MSLAINTYSPKRKVFTMADHSEVRLQLHCVLNGIPLNMIKYNKRQELFYVKLKGKALERRN